MLARTLALGEEGGGGRSFIGSLSSSSDVDNLQRRTHVSEPNEINVSEIKLYQALLKLY